MSPAQNASDEPPHQAIPQPEPDDGSVFGRTLTSGEAAILSSTSAGVLGLSTRAGNAATTLGFGTALDIARASRQRLAELKNVGRRTVAEFRSVLIQALGNGALTVATIDPACGHQLQEQIEAILSKLDPRSNLVLHKRFGLWDAQKKTLEEVAGTFLLTRERVRQIEAKAIKQLRTSPVSITGLSLLMQLRDFLLDAARYPAFGGLLTSGDLDLMVEIPSDATDPESSVRPLALRFLIAVFDEDFEHFKEGLAAQDDGAWFRTDAEARRFRTLEAETRTLLTARGRPVSIDEVARRLEDSGLQTTEPELRRLAETSPDIAFSVGALALRRWTKFRRGRAAARIERALGDLGQPTHYSFIVEKLNFLFPEKAPFVGHAVAATMLRYPNVFVSLGRGTYALRNWGVSRPPYVKDFVIECLKRAGGEATIEQVAALGTQKYGFKKSSIAMTMSLNPTFFEHVRGTLYRLR